MWIVENQDGTCSHYGNLSSHAIESELIAKHPGAKIYKSADEIHNEFGALAFAKKWVKTGERKETIPVIIKDENGNDKTETQEITHDEMSLEKEKNTFRILDNYVIIESENKEIIGKFEMILVYPNHE